MSVEYIPQFISKLHSIRKDLEIKNEKITGGYREVLLFYPITDDTTRYQMLRRGYWSYLFFGAAIEHVAYGLQIRPGKSFLEWPVHRNSDGDYSHLFAPGIATFLPFLYLRKLQDEDRFSTVSLNWNYIMEVCEPIVELFGTKPYLETFKNYAFDTANQPEESKEANLTRYLRFWKLFDTSKGHDLYHEYVDRLNDDSEWLPEEFPEEDLGIWETRIKVMLASRAYQLTTEDPNESSTIPIVWQGYTMPHGADFQDVNYGHYHTSVCATRNAMHRFAKDIYLFGSDESMRLHPLYKTLDPLSKAFRKYAGEEHYQAALEIEAQGKPLEAWNALVSASYWAGANGHPDLVAKHWQYAITLCEKQSWTEAHEALTLQWEWYQEYLRTTHA